MEENVDDNNKILENSCDPEDIEFEYNFITIPWDDRSNRSKIGIMALLIAIFVATIACVINSFVMHYRGINTTSKLNINEISCILVKFDDYRFVARIHSVSSKELLCVGAVVSRTSIIANGACVQSDPIRIFLGGPTEQHCKKGFTPDVIESVNHDESASKKLVLLSSFESFGDCSDVINIGQKLNWKEKVHIIGRPSHIGRSFSRQRVTLADKEIDVPTKHLNENKMICVKDVAKCPVRAGDLLIQRGYLFGLAATNVKNSARSKLVCFADLHAIQQELNDLDGEIKFN